MFDYRSPNKPINRTPTRWLGSLRSHYSQQVRAVYRGVKSTKRKFYMNKAILILMFGLAGCATKNVETVKYENRCENFVRDESTGVKFVAFDKAMKRVAPKYPVKAAINNVEGYVVMVFDITKEGNTDIIEVIESFPSNVFDVEAKRALSQWLYQPAEKDGVPTRSTCHEVTLEFKLG